MFIEYGTDDSFKTCPGRVITQREAAVMLFIYIYIYICFVYYVKGVGMHQLSHFMRSNEV